MIRVSAPAKINLALHVRYRRPDGFHELETLFAFVRDGDWVELERAEHDRLEVTGPFAQGLDGGADNLVVRAAACFREAFGVVDTLSLRLGKHLPVASGIGGGSADAAATLRGLALMFDVDRADPRLAACAERLGSDVPACLLGTTAVGRGRGERLEEIAGALGTPVLLVNPGVPVPTAAVFAGWDGLDRGPLGEGELLARAAAGRNDLEDAAIAIAPAISEVLDMLRGQPGVVLARMSGSGATCFALFADEQALRAAAVRIARENRDWWLLETALL